MPVVCAYQLVHDCKGLLECLQELHAPRHDQGLKSVYSNAVDAAQFKDLKNYATSRMAFKHVAAKETASVHVKDLDLNTSLVIAFNRSGYAAHCLLPFACALACHQAVCLWRPCHVDCSLVPMQNCQATSCIVHNTHFCWPKGVFQLQRVCTLSRNELHLRKIKSGSIKPFFLTLMHQQPSPDVRLKLIAQNFFAKVS